MASHLGWAELSKYPWRIEKFLEKFRNEELFTLVDGTVIKLLYSYQIETWIKTEDRKNLMGEIFSTGNGSCLKLSDLRKTGEFGGKDSEHATRIESGEIISLNRQLEQIRNETSLVDINLKIHSNVYSVAVCSKVNGTPKADFSLSDSLGNTVIWLSHKKGKKVTDFQQWGGMTEKGVINHSEIQSFTGDIRNMYPGGLGNKKTYIRFINDQFLKNQAVYGEFYNCQPFGEQNVTAVVQGSIELTRSDNLFSIQANHIYTNGEEITGEYEPVLGVRYTNERNQFGVKHARFMITPKEGRKYEII